MGAIQLFIRTKWILVFSVYFCCCFGGWLPSLAVINIFAMVLSAVCLFIKRVNCGNLVAAIHLPTPTPPTSYLWFCWNFQFNFPRCHFTLFALTSFLSGFQLPFISPVFFFDAWQDAFDRRRLHLHKPIQDTDTRCISSCQDIRM